jgi:hypothetical protein
MGTSIDLIDWFAFKGLFQYCPISPGGYSIPVFIFYLVRDLEIGNGKISVSSRF